MKEPGQWRSLLAQGLLLLLPLSALFGYVQKVPILNGGMEQNRLMPLAETVSRFSAEAGLQPCESVGFASDLEGIVHDSRLMVSIFALTPAVLRMKSDMDIVLVWYEGGEPEALLPGEGWSLVKKASDPGVPGRSFALMRRDAR